MALADIRQPSDLRTLSHSQLDELSGEIRDFIVAAVAETGGHLGSNLGAVELTLALHRVEKGAGVCRQSSPSQIQVCPHGE
jgi:1-deoxy-D-xylulose-5-phosphate synthase